MLSTMLMLTCTPSGSEWVSLFDGNSLNGWKASENPDTWKVEDGKLVCEGPRSHLFYIGEYQNANFKNFELEADVMTMPGANSGIYFHTEYQETGWPDKGYEVQVNNTHIGAGDYRELKKTGSLYAIRNQYKTIVKDNEWFSVAIRVVNKRVMVKINDMLVVDYIEPKNPIRQDSYAARLVANGTFALQGHDPDSKVYYKNIMVKALPDDLEETQPEPAIADEISAQIDELHAGNFPVIDAHVHLKGGLTLEEAKANSRRVGINYGIAPNCGVGFPITDDQGIYDFVESMEGQPVFLGMQAEGREWVSTFSKEAISQFDYVFSDALTFTDDDGNRTQLWEKETVHIKDKQDFMEMYIDRIQSVMNDEPIDIFVNPTFLPEEIEAEYDELWTEERMQKVIDAAVKNQIAIEINARFKIPSAKFIKMGKASGVKYVFGTNNGAKALGRLEYCLEMMKECGLTSEDMYILPH